MNIREVLEDSRLDISPVTPSKVSQFHFYLELLVKWNKNINLTSEKSPQEILERHVFDSLQYKRVLSLEDDIVDIGSGAGFPGLPLKIVYPNMNITLIESQRKRCSFLETVIFELDLKEIQVINQRAEQIIPEGRFGAVVFRAVSDISRCLELADPFLEMGGKAILKKELKNEKLKDPLPRGFSLVQERVIFGYNNMKSSLLVFEKRIP